MYDQDALWSEHTTHKNRQDTCDRDHENGTYTLYRGEFLLFTMIHYGISCLASFATCFLFTAFVSAVRFDKNVSFLDFALLASAALRIIIIISLL